MKLFLKLKHWQIFTIWILGTIQLMFFINTDLWIVSFGIYFGLIFGWIYSIGIVLNKNDSKTTKQLNIWSIIYFISAVPFGIMFHNMMSNSSQRLNGLILFASSISGLISIIYIGIISAKSLKEKEKQKEQKFSDYIIEFILVLYMIIGIWILQPRLNKIMTKKKH